MLPVYARLCETVRTWRPAVFRPWFALALATLCFAAAGCAGLGIDHALTLEFTGDTRHACMARAYQTVARREARAYGRFGSAQRFLDLAEAARTGDGDPIAAPTLPHGSPLALQHAALRAALTRWPEGACGCADAKAFFAAWQDSLIDTALNVTVPGEKIDSRRSRYAADYASAHARCEAGS